MSAYAKTSLLLTTPFRSLRQSLLNSTIDKETGNTNPYKKKKISKLQKNVPQKKLNPINYPNTVNKDSNQMIEMSQMTMSQFSSSYEASIPPMSQNSYKVRSVYPYNRQSQSIRNSRDTLQCSQRYARSNLSSNPLTSSKTSKKLNMFIHSSQTRESQNFETNEDCDSIVLSQPLLPESKLDYQKPISDRCDSIIPSKGTNKTNDKNIQKRNTLASRKRSWMETCIDVISTPYRKIRTSRPSLNHQCVVGIDKVEEKANQDNVNKTMNIKQHLQFQENNKTSHETNRSCEKEIKEEKEISQHKNPKHAENHDCHLKESDKKIENNERNILNDLKNESKKNMEMMKKEHAANITLMNEKITSFKEMLTTLEVERNEVFQKVEKLEKERLSFLQVMEDTKKAIDLNISNLDQKSKEKENNLCMIINKFSEDQKKEIARLGNLYKIEKDDANKEKHANIIYLESELQKKITLATRKIMNKIEISKPNNVSLSAIDHSTNSFEGGGKHKQNEVADISTTLSPNKSHKTVRGISSTKNVCTKIGKKRKQSVHHAKQRRFEQSKRSLSNEDKEDKLESPNLSKVPRRSKRLRAAKSNEIMTDSVSNASIKHISERKKLEESKITITPPSVFSIFYSESDRRCEVTPEEIEDTFETSVANIDSNVRKEDSKFQTVDRRDSTREIGQKQRKSRFRFRNVKGKNCTICTHIQRKENDSKLPNIIKDLSKSSRSTSLGNSKFTKTEKDVFEFN